MHPWVPETIQILIDLWSNHSTAEITEAVNEWHRRNAQMNGRRYWPSTTEPGVMYQAAKLGLITKRKASAFYQKVKKLRARMHYVNPKVRLAVLERDKHRCLLCGAADNLEVDHIIPVSDGGTAAPENLQTLCRSCHRSHKGCLHVDFRKPYAKKHCPVCHENHYRNV
jgi:hypothetical protein